MNLVTEDKVVLKSVGCVFDTKQGITYPIMTDDTIDWDGGVDVMVTDCEWFQALSPKDFTIVEKYFTDEELDMDERMMRLENEDKKADAQRNMAWYALAGMLLYPVCVVVSVVFGIDQAAKILGDMAGVYFIAVAGIVAAFFGAQAMANKPPKK